LVYVSEQEDGVGRKAAVSMEGLIRTGVENSKWEYLNRRENDADSVI